MLHSRLVVVNPDAVVHLVAQHERQTCDESPKLFLLSVEDIFGLGGGPWSWREEVGFCFREDLSWGIVGLAQFGRSQAARPSHDIILFLMLPLSTWKPIHPSGTSLRARFHQMVCFVIFLTSPGDLFCQPLARLLIVLQVYSFFCIYVFRSK